MIVALKNKSELIEANSELCRAQNYHCPSCKSPVHLKVGAVMRPHFAHYRNEACDFFSEGETAEHIQGKMELKEWLEELGFNIELEAYLPKLKQRPDLLLVDQEIKVAIEFQCSSIPIHKVVERTKGYTENGYKVIWILGEQFEYKKQLTAFQKSCLTNIENQLVLFHYSVTKKRMEYRYAFELKQNGRMRCLKRILNKNERLELKLEKKRQKDDYFFNLEVEHHKLLRQLAYSPDFNRRFLESLYDNQETLVSMPKELYYVMPHEWMLQSQRQYWKFAFIIWLEQKSLNTVVTQKQLNRFLRTLQFHQIPQATPAMKQKPLLEFMNFLMYSDVLKQIRLDKWILKKYPKRYKNLEEKFE